LLVRLHRLTGDLELEQDAFAAWPDFLREVFDADGARQLFVDPGKLTGQENRREWNQHEEKDADQHDRTGQGAAPGETAVVG